LTVEQGFGGLLIVVGAAQAVAAWRGDRAAGTGSVLQGLSFASMGLYFLLRNRAPELRLGSLALWGSLAVADAAARRRQMPRMFIAVCIAMAVFVGVGVLDYMGYLDNVPHWVDRALGWTLAAVLAGLLIWAVVAVVRAFIAPFRPLPPPS
jgi:hypothetical protein